MAQPLVSPKVEGKRVLLISYILPPAGGVGVQRALSFLRYLPKCGCPVVALTASNPVTPVYDPALVAQIPAGTRIYRTPTLEPPHRLRSRIWERVSRGTAFEPGATPRRSGGLKGRVAEIAERLTAPDPQKAWRPLAARAARRIVEREKIDAVIVSVPPFSSLRIGVELKRKYPHLLLISDFRDEWLDFYLAKLDPPPSPYRLAVCRREEAEAIRASDAVVTVTETMMESIRSRYPDQPRSKFHSVLNGYDPAQYSGFHPRPSPPRDLLVAYAGTLYENPLFTPLRWISAVEGLEPELRARVRTRLIGRSEGNVRASIEASPAPSEFKGFLPQAEMLRELEDADLLLLVVGIATSMAGKMFDYFGTGKPILALTPPGSEVARLLDETRGGFHADLEDPAAIRTLIRKLMEWKEAGKPFTPDRVKIETFSRPVLAEQLAYRTGLVGR
jgi:hypothetical protein